MVEIARDEPAERAGSLQSLCWGSRVRRVWAVNLREAEASLCGCILRTRVAHSTRCHLAVVDGIRGQETGHAAVEPSLADTIVHALSEGV